MTDQQLLSTAALTTFRLNGQFLDLAEELARPAGTTAARWQVLGAVLQEPMTVAGIARSMGITRQSVQRLADVLVAEGSAEYIDNPNHRRAKLLRPTPAGFATIERIDPLHADAARRLVSELGTDALQAAISSMTALSIALDRMTLTASVTQASGEGGIRSNPSPDEPTRRRDTSRSKH